MFVGLGLGYRAQLNRDNLRFAKQVGASHIVASLLNGAPVKSPGGASEYVLSRSRPDRWSETALVRLRSEIEEEGLLLAAVESIEPADWYDVLLDGPRRDEQMAGLAQLIRNLGQAGVPMLGYNFSLAVVWGRQLLPVARGGASTWQFDDPDPRPISRGMIWNQVYDEETFGSSQGVGIDPVSRDELWGRLERFLTELLPVADQSGVKLALHPEDPPLPTLRGTPRVVHRPELYDRVLTNPSPNNCIALCVGTLSEVPDSNVYEAVDFLSQTGKVGYVHLRNVKGKAPHYTEAFVDDGDTDIPRILKVLARNGYDGVVVPDHTPELDCAAPWHAGMAYALGWMRAALAGIGALSA
jgi:mannonate dehydratase